jgi:hypothetical protein
MFEHLKELETEQLKGHFFSAVQYVEENPCIVFPQDNIKAFGDIKAELVKRKALTLH